MPGLRAPPSVPLEYGSGTCLPQRRLAGLLSGRRRCGAAEFVAAVAEPNVSSGRLWWLEHDVTRIAWLRVARQPGLSDGRRRYVRTIRLQQLLRAAVVP